MPRPKSESELELLEAQREALERKIREVTAREKARRAQEDHRRWQLAGQCAVREMLAKPDSDFFRVMMSLLDATARSASDRALFGLPTLKGTDSQSPINADTATA